MASINSSVAATALLVLHFQISMTYDLMHLLRERVSLFTTNVNLIKSERAVMLSDNYRIVHQLLNHTGRRLHFEEKRCSHLQPYFKM